MRNLLFLIAAALGALLPSCTPANRVVENPLIATANTQTLDIVKVELSDTATVLHMNAYYRPKNWIVISSDSYLQIPARRFMLTGAEGITPDSLFWMPNSCCGFLPCPAEQSRSTSSNRTATTVSNSTAWT